MKLWNDGRILRFLMSVITPGRISPIRFGSESRCFFLIAELPCTCCSERIQSICSESAEGVEYLKLLDKSLHIGFYLCYDLAGRGRLVLVGLFESRGVGFILFFEKLVAGDNFLQGFGFCFGLS